MSWKFTRPDLKPTVLTLAMLLPMTSIMIWWPRRPEIAENIERSIWSLLRTGVHAQWRDAFWRPRPGQLPQRGPAIDLAHSADLGSVTRTFGSGETVRR